MRKIILLLFFISTLFIQLGNAQESFTRIQTIKNKLEVLKVETPGLQESLNINITQTTLSNFLLAISELHEININVSPELSSINIVNNFSNVSVADILIFLVKEYNLEIDFTGNILSIRKYVKPITPPKEKEILVTYYPANNTVSMDLKNDSLDAVFRKIMDQTGKNLLYTPDIEENRLSIYLKNVSFETALSKLAEANNLILNKTDDGFYTFDTAFIAGASSGNTSGSRPQRKKQSDFFYRVLDTVNKRVEVDFQNTPISDIIYTLAPDLKIDVFTASPLENAGTSTVRAKDISFDLLLDKIFQSNSTFNSTRGNPNPQTPNQSTFTYKKDGRVYYFGTENQLSLKQVELISMMYRSVQLLDNPSGGGQKRGGRNSFTSNFSGTGNFQNPSQNTRPISTSSSTNTRSNTFSIESIIPDDIKEGLDIKIDTELNSFVVSGPGVKVERFKRFIEFIDKPVPVILIEVMILEINRSALTETGISFGIGDRPTTTRGEFFPSGNVTLNASDVNKVIGNFNGFGSLNIGKVVPNFYLDIKAMESAGTLKVKSTPKLTTINGHKAFLSSGETTYYAVTSQSFYGSQIPQTSEIRNYVPIDAELSLEILPFVSGNGQITLDIQVLQSAFNGERIAEDAPPGITSREFSSIVRMQDQDVVVLGGIESIRKDDSGSGVPFLARVPILKYLFSKRRRETSKRNLNILIKPTIIE